MRNNGGPITMAKKSHPPFFLKRGHLIFWKYPSRVDTRMKNWSFHWSSPYISSLQTRDENVCFAESSLISEQGRRPLILSCHTSNTPLMQPPPADEKRVHFLHLVWWHMEHCWRASNRVYHRTIFHRRKEEQAKKREKAWVISPHLGRERAEILEESGLSQRHTHERHDLISFFFFF